jgi:hypothetical protein
MVALHNTRCEKYKQIHVLTAFGFIRDCVFHLSNFGNTQEFQVGGSLKNTTNYTIPLFMTQKKKPEIGKDIDNRVTHVFHSWQYRIKGIICPATYFKSEANLQKSINFTLSISIN